MARRAWAREVTRSLNWHRRHTLPTLPSSRIMAVFFVVFGAIWGRYDSRRISEEQRPATAVFESEFE
jgi:hypothetical protein